MYQRPWRKGRRVRPLNVNVLETFAIGHDVIESRGHVKHEGLTFDASKLSTDEQLVPPSYGTTAGKHVVWEGLLVIYVFVEQDR